jgi:hypothetical protein
MDAVPDPFKLAKSIKKKGKTSEEGKISQFSLQVSLKNTQVAGNTQLQKPNALLFRLNLRI